MEIEKVSLATLLGGLAVERFDDELARVLMNIVDPNTPAEKVRGVTLKVSIKPDKNRGLGRVSLSVSSQMASAANVETAVFISQTRNGVVATEHNPNQLPLPMEPVGVTQLRPVSPAGGSK